MGALFDQVVAMVQQEGWRFDRSDPEKETVIVHFRGDNGTWTTNLKVLPMGSDENPFDLLLIQAFLDRAIPAARRPAVEELIVRVNYRTLYGHWDLEVDTGSMSFCTSNLFHRDSDAGRVLGGAMLYNQSSIDGMIPPLMQVIYANTSAQDALAKLDQADDTTPSPPDPSAAPGAPPCPKCGQALTYIAQYQRNYCYTCAQYA